EIEMMPFVEEIKLFPGFEQANVNTPFNLTAAAYRGKALLAAQEREHGLSTARTAWGLWIVSICLGAMSALAIYAPRVFLWGSAGVGVLSVFGCGGIATMWM